MEEDKKTGWFPIEVSPVRDGEYEYRMLGGNISIREYRGKYWRRSNGQPFLICLGDHWRGIKKEA